MEFLVGTRANRSELFAKRLCGSRAARAVRGPQSSRSQKKTLQDFLCWPFYFQAQRPNVKLRCGGYRDTPNWFDLVPMRGPGCVSGRRGDVFSRFAGG